MVGFSLFSLLTSIRFHHRYFPAAARAFGKFQSSFLTELHAEIMSHVKQEASGLAPKPVHGITVHDSEVLEPEPIRAGGLMRSDTVRSFLSVCRDLRLYIKLYRDMHSDNQPNLSSLQRHAVRSSG